MKTAKNYKICGEASHSKLATDTVKISETMQLFGIWLPASF
jgi:hypothetical protein